MGKNFSNNNPLENLSAVVPAGKVPDEEPKMTDKHKKQPEAAEPEEKPEKRKAGRPKTKTEETRTISIAVPVSVLEKLETVKSCYSNNLTLYINKLIEKDIEANFDSYEHIADSLNRFK